MSIPTILSQKYRPYKIEVYGLQDDFIGTLQSYNDSFIGQIISPEIQFSDDGTQTFTCSIPKFYINPETNLKTENPRWADINNGILAENTRILKIFLDYGNEIKVYPFIINKITDKRDSHFSVYREIEASGMAFSELGKTGYKLELNSHTIKSVQKEDIEKLPTINFWLDYVFPNEKDENGKIIKWLTPWCYEIRMDWSHYAAKGRLSNKIYEDSYVTSWGVRDAQSDEYGNITIAAGLEAQGISLDMEKARYIDCANSNKYNITQDISKAFEVFCQYEYKCDSRGHFLKEYVEKIKDENNEEVTKVWTGRKVVFYNRAIKTDDPVIIDYKKNLSTITRTCDSSEIYTKLYVTPIESSIMETGYISIADTPINPTLDEFILNFDYLYSTGSISQYQLNYVKTYEVKIHKLNAELINLAPQIEDLTIRINNLEATKTNTENEKTSAEQTLQQYETLRDSEVTNTPIRKNKDNPMSIIFVEDGDIKKAALRQVGIAPATIVGYNNNSYTEDVKIFDYNSLITINQIGSTTVNDTSYYLVLDEFGYPTDIYTSKNNNINSIIYLELEYSPKNAYVDICNQLEQRIIEKITAAETLKTSIEQLQTTLNQLESEQKNLLNEKEFLNQKLELTLGPALREGYWTPDSYEDPGQARKVELTMVPTAAQTGAVLTFDNTAFEGEELNYYYANIDDVAKNNKTYYPYIDISSIYEKWSDQNIENLTLHFLNPECKYTVGNNKIAAGNYFVIYNGLTKYYFEIPEDLTEGTVVEILINNDSEPVIKIGDTSIITSQDELEGATNLTSIFEGIGNYLGERLVYNNAGFVFGFLKEKKKEEEKEYEIITPILLLNNLDINYSRYKKVSYSFNGDNRKEIDNQLRINEPPTDAIFCYPRIIIYDSNVNYDSDNLKIIPYTKTLTEEAQKLKKFYDYTILVRGGKPHFTLKITENNNLNKILTYSYHIEYQISRANEMLYLDAKNVARDNSYPKYSYELSIANTPDNISFYELGQLILINDYLIGASAATGYISGITYKLDNPQDDKIQIKNYKTKFEDLFSTITASSETIKNNQHAYSIAANGFNSDGTIEGTILQDSILKNDIAMNYSNTNVSIDGVDGIILTNQRPYINGVYGQIKLTGGGIFLSSAIDGTGARIWNTGITPNGINAALITAGQLDVSRIRVFAGDNTAFQWNSEGIFAYKQSNGSVDLNTYVQYSDKGLQFISGNHTALDLGWNGLLISTQDGSTELDGKLGLTVYYGKKNSEGNNYAVRLGKFSEDSTSYGLRLYKETSKEDQAGNNYTVYEPTLVTTNDGKLWLKDSLTIGEKASFDKENEKGEKITVDCVAGISGYNVFIDDDEKEKDPVRFWAGSTEAQMTEAPFRVLQSGQLYAKEAIIAGEINADIGAIGGWKIGSDSLSTIDGKTILYSSSSSEDENQLRLKIGDFFNVDKDGTLTASNVNISGTITATDGTIGKLEIDEYGISTGTIKFNDEGLKIENGVFSILDSSGVSRFSSDGKGNINFSGTLTGPTGTLGGWTINENEIVKDNDVGLHTGTIQYDNIDKTDYIRFWAGRTEIKTETETETITDYNFIVSSKGKLIAKQANIWGNIIAESGNITGSLEVGGKSGILLDGKNGFISSANYSSGLGSGWKITKDGDATFNNITARGKISSVYFEQDKISSVGGSLYIAPTLYFDIESGEIEEDSTQINTVNTEANSVIEDKLYKVDFTTFNLQNYDSHKWADGDIVQINGYITQNNNDSIEISDIEGKIIAIPSEDSTQHSKTITVQFKFSGSSQLNGKKFLPGTSLIYIGSGNKRTGIYLTAQKKDSPYIDIYEYEQFDDLTTIQIPAVRLGNLASITDNNFGEGTLSGYGLYSNNAYLRGQLALPGAGITNQTNTKYGDGDASSPIRIWAGLTNQENDITKANFIVTENGYMYAKHGIFEGTVKASNSEFSGTIKAAGIVVEEGSDDLGLNPISGKDHFFVAYTDQPTNFNDYVLDIGKHGLSIWEGALRAYSDYASNSESFNTLYGYGTYNDATYEQPLPYFSLADDGEGSELNARIVAHKAHFLTLKEEIKNESQTQTEGGSEVNPENGSTTQNKNYLYNSVIIDNGIWFNKGSRSDDKTLLEGNIFKVTSNRTGFFYENSILNIQGRVKISDGQISLGEQWIEEAKDTNNNSIGINIKISDVR